MFSARRFSLVDMVVGLRIGPFLPVRRRPRHPFTVSSAPARGLETALLGTTD